MCTLARGVSNSSSPQCDLHHTIRKPPVTQPSITGGGSPAPSECLPFWQPLAIGARLAVGRALRPSTYRVLLPRTGERNRRDHRVTVERAVRFRLANNLEVLHDVPFL